MRRQRSTIRDVARRAGVSVTTVSHTFSGNGVVNPATQARVRAAATELGYHPDVVASGLRRSRLGVIGLVLRPAVGAEPQQIQDVDYFPRFAGAAALTSLAHGYALMLVADPTVPQAPTTAWACDGIIVTDPVEGDPLIAALRAGGMPYTLVGADVADPGDPHIVDIATALITDRVLEHLAACGAQRIALVVGTDPIEWNTATEQRYRERVPEEAQIVLSVPERAEPDEGAVAADALLALPLPPDGVYCMTSDHARALVDRLVARGVRVPEDVRVVCGSDAERLRGISPEITAVDLQPQALGRQAAAELLRQLEPELALAVPAPEHGTLVVRASTAG
ncbi:LacI family DNA-binding transcriptional regulator [Microbacterium azadirachtae]|uniref:LacI family DNA-binding transcriptional regulator n=1 Tax=Microbacterium azadirachtae TaxID=582680 RepID=UPI00087E4E08|nr:LacI family DNA-binding transcriptional regulator [Microbacterium azadirachtae]UXW84986.1 LacI family transcriptional regulator [Microbacterium azadirachtae]SDM04542.1 DNA-binding transcriptional regulator, LacI/PurR family [Microbacterium azadirachtae]SEG30098.1 DNA-binding transcriptional regulator, LacI/PurR family [Microbacterium azadirachtae]SEG33026.1 DNA-binding transcriptional regulator, LacI/PurR family [Microbacterium azadirachtae]